MPHPHDRHAELIRSLCEPMTPRPTPVPPRISLAPGLRAVLFDVCGTLFAAGTGDAALHLEHHRESALREALRVCGFAPREDKIAGQLSEQWFNRYRGETERLRSEGVRHPEVDAREVWRGMLSEWTRCGVLDESAAAIGNDGLEALTIEYDFRVNAAWPMPGARETLTALREAGVVMGVVSNAQFFTPALFSALLGAPPGELGFDPALCVWSFEEGEAKPSTRLFEKAASALREKYAIPADLALFIGNDMRNDVWPAQTAGFKTALFAGDRRSLRLRDNDADVKRTRPDWVITEIRQVLEILGKT
ncbi:MAG: HAD family hydrolase [bacterium]|nr:HAD family hydrolase [bacterium]